MNRLKLAKRDGREQGAPVSARPAPIAGIGCSASVRVLTCKGGLYRTHLPGNIVNVQLKYKSFIFGAL